MPKKKRPTHATHDNRQTLLAFAARQLAQEQERHDKLAAELNYQHYPSVRRAKTLHTLLSNMTDGEVQRVLERDGTTDPCQLAIDKLRDAYLECQRLGLTQDADAQYDPQCPL